ncbi:MAG: PP0621 family protein [Gammaproteobacteria bacterium]|jgi:ribosomal protein S26
MGLIRFIVIVSFIWLVVVLIQKLRQQGQGGHGQRQKISVIKKKMVQCAYCSIYVPKEDALQRNDNYFCCPDHMQIEQKKS